jgi:hypothetical protein
MAMTNFKPKQSSYKMVFYLLAPRAARFGNVLPNTGRPDGCALRIQQNGVVPRHQAPVSVPGEDLVFMMCGYASLGQLRYE